MTGLEAAIIEITSFLEEQKIPYMIIGGIANAFWGVPRATVDIDITIKVEDKNLDSFIGKLVKKFKPYPDNPAQFVKETRVLPVKTANGTRVDIIFGQLPYEDDAIKRARPKDIDSAKVKICSPEDLIVHKIISERFKDREDVEGIISAQKESLDHTYLDPIIEQLAKELSQPEILSFYRGCLAKTKR